MVSEAMPCPVFRPTEAEFSSFAAYIRHVIEPQCQHIGLCKVIPPPGFFMRSYDDLEFTIPTLLNQHVAGKKGVFHVDLVERKSMPLAEFRSLAAAASQGMDDPASASFETLERKFWKGLRPTMEPPTYGADIVGSLFGDEHAMSWNVNKLDSILRSVDLPGITQAMLYFGMWSAIFALHTEDMELYSINFLHTGKPKVWYAIPPQQASRVERICQTMFPDEYMTCHQFLRHKTSLISPSKLQEFDIPYTTAVQGPGEYIITFPRSYHQGFNTGFNIAESVNFATLRWIPRGLDAKLCKCMPDNVTLDMDLFLTQLFALNSKALEPNDWVFSCVCQKYASSVDEHVEVEDKWFECSKCKIWCHLWCRYPDLWSTKEEDLPTTLLCHRCFIEPKPVVSPSSVMTTPVKTTARKKDFCVKNAILWIQSEGDSIREAKVVTVDGKYLRVHFKGEASVTDEWIPFNSSIIIGGTKPRSPYQKAKKSRKA
ncbi:unnamed protein product [Aphanomyces euteiches]|uniref:JmjC domain-containing protein n=1 Tax=Aphanomyces euteiches TaxID=100861 RepID=A0A6G0WAD3_9STRA|nr:hypothetical protein Ae201684_016982 [Aphanomyces euteiches]KAH9158034.1 hypothetical protein AeRB84_000169 [Aphanomyces euteiches]